MVARTDATQIIEAVAEELRSELGSGVMVTVWVGDAAFVAVDALTVRRPLLGVGRAIAEGLGVGGQLSLSMVEVDDVDVSAVVSVCFTIEGDGPQIAADAWERDWIPALRDGGSAGFARQWGVDEARAAGAVLSMATGPSGTTFTVTVPAHTESPTRIAGEAL